MEDGGWRMEEGTGSKIGRFVSHSLSHVEEVKKAEPEKKEKMKPSADSTDG